MIIISYFFLSITILQVFLVILLNLEVPLNNYYEEIYIEIYNKNSI